MSDKLSILLISSSRDLLRSLALKVEAIKGGSVKQAKSSKDAIKLLSPASHRIILFDFELGENDCMTVLEHIQSKKMEIPTILMIESKDEVRVENLLKLGAYDYILKTESEFEKTPYLIQSILDRYQLGLRERKLEEEVARQKASLHQINQKLATFAVKDELTGAYNHRYFQEKLYEEFLRAKRYSHLLSCLMLDIDYFKSINDVRGHLVGDEVLKELAGILTENLRPMDVLARFGGEEFVMLFPHIGYEGATQVAERMKTIIANHVFLPGRYDLRLTVSIGISAYPEDPLLKYDDLTHFADKALFRAKGNKGRNSVCAYATIMKEIEAQTSSLKFSVDKIAEFRKRLLDVSETAKRAYIESTKALVYALEAKDKYTLGHASRVAQYSALVAREMGLQEEDVSTIEHAGLLHDVGKVCITDEILLKPGAFTMAEFEKMKEHPSLGYQMIRPIKFLKEEALIILHHHEWYNGKGYPHHLKGKEIPIGARVVAALDAYDTMRASGARYKKTLTCQETVREMIAQSGTQFDPEVVAALVRALVKRGEIQEGSYDKDKLEQAVSQIAS